MSDTEHNKEDAEIAEEEVVRELSPEEIRKIQDILIMAKNAFQKSHFAYAVELYFSILKIDPDDVDAAQMFFPSAMATRQTKGKNPVFDVLLFLENIPLYIKWLIAKARKKNDDIFYILLEILKKEAQNFLVLKQLGSLALDLQHVDIAINAYERYKAIRPKDLPVLKALGRIFMSLDKKEKAKAIFKTILRISPFDSDANKGLKDISATVTIEKSKWDDEENFRTKIKDEDDAKLTELQTHMSQSDHEVMMIIEANKKALTENPTDLRTLRTMAESYMKVNNPKESLVYMKQLSDLQPGDADLALSVHKLDCSLMEEDDKPREEKIEFLLNGYKKLCHTFPTNYRLRYDFGLKLLNENRYDEAIAEFQASVISPNLKAYSINQLGICFESKNILDLAIDQYKKGITEINEAMNELGKEMTYNLARTYEKSEHNDDALINYKKIYQVDISYKDVAQKIEKFYKKD